MRALLVLLCCGSANGIRINQSAAVKGEDLAPYPSVVISGIGDSGTTAILRALHTLGLWLCGKRDIFEEPPLSHQNRKLHIQRLLNASRGEMTQRAYRRNKAAFQESVIWLRDVARHEAECVTYARRKNSDEIPSDRRWGFKEPHYVWLLPSMDVAYHNSTRYLVVARDPRDVCTNKLQDQFTTYSKFIGDKDCYTWWATFWRNLLDAYEAEPRFAVIRIEDLVLHTPKSVMAKNVMRCMVNHTGMSPQWPEMHEALVRMRLGNDSAHILSLYGHRLDPDEDRLRVQLMRDPQKSSHAEAERQLDLFHRHTHSYFGHHYNFTEAKRTQLKEKVANRTDLHPVMRRLGYDPLDFQLLAPTSRAVLCQPF